MTDAGGKTADADKAGTGGTGTGGTGGTGATGDASKNNPTDTAGGSVPPLEDPVSGEPERPDEPPVAPPVS